MGKEKGVVEIVEEKKTIRNNWDEEIEFPFYEILLHHFM